MDGEVQLLCGIGEAACNLDLPEILDDEEYVLMICELVDKQLVERPEATLVCPAGTLHIKLITP